MNIPNSQKSMDVFYDLFKKIGDAFRIFPLVISTKEGDILKKISIKSSIDSRKTLLITEEAILC